jgi:hypothetical protein
VKLHQRKLLVVTSNAHDGSIRGPSVILRIVVKMLRGDGVKRCWEQRGRRTITQSFISLSYCVLYKSAPKRVYTQKKAICPKKQHYV